MAERTIYLYEKSAMTMWRSDGTPTHQQDVIGAALNGDAFSWENPSDLTLTFPGSTVALTFDDSDGELTDDPFAGSTVKDQQLTEEVTINGTTYTPSDEHVRWKSDPPVNVENEYEVTLYDDDGNMYTMVGVSITQGYNTEVVGVMFEGPEPPPGTVLTYRQGVSKYTGEKNSMTIQDTVVCYLAGTLIETPDGPRPIESLQPGNPVITLDHGPMPLRWAGRFTVFGRGPLAPIRIAAGALGNRRDLLVSPNHRILLRAPQVELLFGAPEVLVPAKALVNGTTIHAAPMRRVTYHHLLLDGHQAIVAEGIASESLFAGDVTLEILDADTVTSLTQTGVLDTRDRLCRPVLSVTEARLLAAALVAAPPAAKDRVGAAA